MAVPDFVKQFVAPGDLPEISIDDLELPNAMKSLLKRNGVGMLSDLAGVPGKDIWAFEGVGRKKFLALCDFFSSLDGVEASEMVATKNAASTFSKLPDIPIEGCGFTERSKNALKRAGITSLKELNGKNIAYLRSMRNIGKGSVSEINTQIELLLDESSNDDSSIDPRDQIDSESDGVRSFKEIAPFEEELSKNLGQAKGWTAQAFRMRVGFGEKKKTLEEVGQIVGVTRERVRQVVSRYISQQQAPRGLFTKFEDALKETFHLRRLPVLLRSLGREHPYFEGLDFSGKDVNAFFEDCIRGFSVINLLEMSFVVNVGIKEWQEIESLARHLADELASRKAAVQEFELDLERLTQALGVESIFIPLKQQLLDEMHIVSAAGCQPYLLGKSKSIYSVIYTILESSPRPMHYEEVAAEFLEITGKDRATRSIHNAIQRAGGILLGRGLYGTEKHIVVPENLQKKICDFVCNITREDTARQWSSKNLSRLCVRKWPSLRESLNEYQLNSVLAKDKRLKYLGRNVWVSIHSDDEAQAARKDLRDLSMQALLEIGGPASPSEIREKILESRGFGPTFQLRTTEDVVPIAYGLWGLIPRDVEPTLPLHEISSMLFNIARQNDGSLSKEKVEEFVDQNNFGRNVTASVVMAVAGLDPRFCPPAESGIELVEDDDE